MNLDDKRRVVHQFAAQLQDNHGQRLTEALIQGLVIKLELMLPDHLIAAARKPLDRMLEMSKNIAPTAITRGHA